MTSPPQPVIPWDGVRDATEFGPAYLQQRRATDHFYGPGANAISEDCLYRNAWAPAEPPEQGLPVMVWIHSGGLVNGTGAQTTYREVALARRGTVVVTINYRLGPFGYLAHPLLSAEDSHDSSGNYGVLDQIAALRWVHESIEALGGDRTRVNILGESAGSWSINVRQATGTLTTGLFNHAIGQSGGQLAGTRFLRRESTLGESAETQGARWTEQLLTTNKRLSSEAGATVPVELESMRRVSGEEIVEFLDETPFVAAPNVDGWVLARRVYDMFASGLQHNVPVLLGSTADEATTLVASSIPQDLAAYRAGVEREFGTMASKHHDVFLATTDDEARRAYMDSFTQRLFGWEMRTWADFMSSKSEPAYLYYFTRTAPGVDQGALRAFHAAEIVYVFDNLGRSHTLRKPRL
ncbi:MAG: carboxylesterase family protein [Acidobacteriota bacterium]|nr:carboxylesterase family protein [Acidobacteriota bacterium]